MRQRGRRSAAAEEVISVDGRSPPLQPPRYLNKAEKQVFAELAATRHFVPTDLGIARVTGTGDGHGPPCCA